VFFADKRLLLAELFILLLITVRKNDYMTVNQMDCCMKDFSHSSLHIIYDYCCSSGEFILCVLEIKSEREVCLLV
jgi:hypothetical protein